MSKIIFKINYIETMIGGANEHELSIIFKNLDEAYLKKIGSGNFGKVYLDTKLKKLVKFNFGQTPTLSDNLNKIKLSSVSDLDNPEFSKERKIVDKIKEIHEQIKDLPSFLQVKGIVIYKNKIHQYRELQNPQKNM